MTSDNEDNDKNEMGIEIIKRFKMTIMVRVIEMIIKSIKIIIMIMKVNMIMMKVEVKNRMYCYDSAASE